MTWFSVQTQPHPHPHPPTYPPTPPTHRNKARDKASTLYQALQYLGQSALQYLGQSALATRSPLILIACLRRADAGYCGLTPPFPLSVFYDIRRGIFMHILITAVYRRNFAIKKNRKCCNRDSVVEPAVTLSSPLPPLLPLLGGDCLMTSSDQ